ncbi:MAG: hypothetical protein AB1630_12375 [bacterium]
MEWVYTNLSQKPAFSLPSAIEVLKNKTGDCNEHTTFNQSPMDAIHIPLIEGDIGKQIGLLGYIGNIDVEVLDYD